jgi:hypothetical protein
MRALVGHSHRWPGPQLDVPKLRWLRDEGRDLTDCHQALQLAYPELPAEGGPDDNPFLESKGGGISVFLFCYLGSLPGINRHQPPRSRLNSVFGSKSQASRLILNSLEHIIAHRWSTASGVRALARGCSTSLAAPDCLGSRIENSRPATPKRPDDSNNQALTCYALVTHTESVLLWKCFGRSKLQKFFPLWQRSSKRLSPGPQNRDFLEKAWKAGSPVTPKTAKTPVCVTHILRTPTAFLQAGSKVAGQTQKVGVMQVLCIPNHNVWTRQNPDADVWPPSE